MLLQLPGSQNQEVRWWRGSKTGMGTGSKINLGLEGL
jgi:hypothetical protein